MKKGVSMANKNKNSLPPLPDTPTTTKNDFGHEHISSESRQGKQEEFSGTENHKSGQTRERNEGKKEEHCPKRTKDTGH